MTPTRLLLTMLFAAFVAGCGAPQDTAEPHSTTENASSTPTLQPESTELTHDLDGLWIVDMDYVIRNQPDLSPEERDFMLEMMEGSSMSLEFASDGSIAMVVAMMDEETMMLGRWSFVSQHGDRIVLRIVSEDDPEQLEEEVVLHVVDADTMRMEGDDGGMLLLIRHPEPN